MDIIELPGTERVVRVRFAGVIYRRYPLSKTSSDRNYFRAGHGDHVKRGRTSLHRDVWTFANGPISDGHDVDHKDGNPLNNAIDNLQLLTEAEHHAKHAHEQGERSRARWAAMSDEQRDAMLASAAAWHSTPAGRAWHAEHARKFMAALPQVDMECERCHGKYTVKSHVKSWGRFCSNKCRAGARRDSGVDNEDRTCQRCGKVFSVNRYSPVANCSLKCARGPGAERPCQRCGKPFKCAPCKPGKFCTQACAHADRRDDLLPGVQPQD